MRAIISENPVNGIIIDPRAMNRVAQILKKRERLSIESGFI